MQFSLDIDNVTKNITNIEETHLVVYTASTNLSFLCMAYFIKLF